MYKKTKRVCAGIILALLVFLFIAPRVYLTRLCDELLALNDAAIEAVRDDRRAGAYLERMYERFDKSAPVLRLYLNHASVDETAAAIAACVPLTDRETLLSGLSTIEILLEHLEGIERFGFANLL